MGYVPPPLVYYQKCLNTPLQPVNSISGTQLHLTVTKGVQLTQIYRWLNVYSPGGTSFSLISPTPSRWSRPPFSTHQPISRRHSPRWSRRKCTKSKHPAMPLALNPVLSSMIPPRRVCGLAWVSISRVSKEHQEPQGTSCFPKSLFSSLSS